MDTEIKKKLDERLVNGDITPDEYQKILNTIESATTENSGGETSVQSNDHSEERVDQSISTSSIPPKTDPKEVNLSQEKGFLKKLRDGDYGLAKTYWVYGIVVGVFFGFILRLILMALRKDGLLLAFGLLVLDAIYIAFYQAPGLWRAAKRYEGPKIWAILGQIIAVLAVISIPFVLIQWLRILAMAGIL